MPLASWLFIRNKESIWVERPYGRLIIVCGPGSHREQHEFDTEEALDAFQVQLGERLTNEGWFLWGFDRDRRKNRERRVIARNTPDRRRVIRFPGPK